MAAARAHARLPVYSGPFGERQATRLLWRAGFGPSPGHAKALAAVGARSAVHSLTRPTSRTTLSGPAPRVGDRPLNPEKFGDDHLYWLDHMVRGDRPLVERMALIWHDWFATLGPAVNNIPYMLGQYSTFKKHGMGSFTQLTKQVTLDPAMQIWLNLAQSFKDDANENYARELMERFTLGAGSGSYTETDVREIARALTGFRKENSIFVFDPRQHDEGVKRIFGKRGNFGWRNVIELVLSHPAHPRFFVERLWSAFIPTAPPARDRRSLELLYVSSGRKIRPVVEAILLHPDLLAGEPMVKPPTVFFAGLMRQLDTGIDNNGWLYAGVQAGQRLFSPPSVAGWDEERWLDSNTIAGRWAGVANILTPRTIGGAAADSYFPDETPALAVRRARAFWGHPTVSKETLSSLAAFAERFVDSGLTGVAGSRARAERQNALRLLLGASPDAQIS